MSTTAKVAKTAIVALIEAVHASDADKVVVVYGPPDAVAVRLDRLVSVGAIRGGTSGLDSMSLDTAYEQYVVEVITSVDLEAAGDEGQQRATEAALDLWARQEAYLREGHDGALGLGGFGVIGARPAEGWELLERASDKGRSAAVRWGVQVIGQRQ